MNRRTGLSPAQIQQALLSLPGWRFSENALERTIEGNTYQEALDTLYRVAQMSDLRDHHPDLSLSWKTLTIRFWTHTAQGVTILDFELAHAVEPLLQAE